MNVYTANIAWTWILQVVYHRPGFLIRSLKMWNSSILSTQILHNVWRADSRWITQPDFMWHVWICLSDTVFGLCLTQIHPHNNLKTKNKSSTWIIFCAALKMFWDAAALIMISFSSASSILSSCRRRSRCTASGLQMDSTYLHGYFCCPVDVYSHFC